jgi:hypothetical protein
MAKLRGTDDVIFANLFLGIGVFNGVINVTLGTLMFTPSDDDEKVAPDPIISARLRMDEICAKKLYDALGRQLERMKVSREMESPPGITEADQPGAKPN